MKPTILHFSLTFSDILPYPTVDSLKKKAPKPTEVVGIACRGTRAFTNECPLPPPHFHKITRSELASLQALSQRSRGEAETPREEDGLASAAALSVAARDPSSNGLSGRGATTPTRRHLVSGNHTYFPRGETEAEGWSLAPLQAQTAGRTPERPGARSP